MTSCDPAVIEYIRNLPKGKRMHPRTLIVKIRKDIGIEIHPAALRFYVTEAGNLKKIDHTHRTLYEVV